MGRAFLFRAFVAWFGAAVLLAVSMPGTGAAAATKLKITGDVSGYLAPGTMVTVSGASSGALKVAGGAKATAALPEGSWLVRARVRSDARVGLSAASKPVSWRRATTWKITEGLVHAPAQGITIALSAAKVLYVDWITVTSAPAVPTTLGRQVIAPDGTELRLHGVNRTGTEFTPSGWYLGPEQTGAMQAWGANVVRIPVAEAFWLSDSCAYDPTYAPQIDKAVYQAIARGMYAIVDLHRVTLNDPCGPNVPGKAPDERALQFWTEAAARYADLPLVLFQIYNEPHDIDAVTWRLGGTVDGTATAGMQELYTAVRATGAHNLVLVPGLNWATDLRHLVTDSLDGYGIAYTAHIYNDGQSTLPEGLDVRIGGASTAVPVVITEFGSPQSPEYMQAAIDWADKWGLSWLAWEWAAGTGQYHELLQSWTTFAPTPMGAVVKAALGAA